MRQQARALHKHLGSDKEHTVYEAELAGMILGTELIFRETQVSNASIRLDNVAAIQATQSAKATAGSYLVDAVQRGVDIAKGKHRRMRMRVQWVPGHEDVEGNEVSD
ncbi:hypothetical protein FA95DRAFT_1507069, partial [Auriscalpium vulgare]